MYAFDYQRPASRENAIAAVTGADSRYLAGGQSLIQAMKLRLSQSDRLVDLAAIGDLKGIAVKDGALAIGAMATHADIAASADVQRLLPALAELAAGIGDPMVRNMGTLGGSVANADPAACYPAAMLALGATVWTHQRSIASDAFFTGLFETALEPGELIVGVTFPALRDAAYVKYKQPASRFALVGVFVCRSDAGVRVAVTGARGSVYRVEELEHALARDFSVASAESVAVSADGLNGDMHGSAAYRAAMIGVMAGRAVTAILAR